MGGDMKKYLFSLGAMAVGAGLMFILMHGEVEADSTEEGLICHLKQAQRWDDRVDNNYRTFFKYFECKESGTTCYFLPGEKFALSCAERVNDFETLKCI
jgi:hypothetical protein